MTAIVDHVSARERRVDARYEVRLPAGLSGLGGLGKKK